MPFELLEISGAELNGRRHVLDSICSGELTGVIVRGVVSPERAAAVVAQLEAGATPQPEFHFDNEAVRISMYGPSLDASADVEAYLQQAEVWRRDSRALAADLEAGLVETLGSLTPMAVQPAEAPSGRPVAHGNIRRLPQGGFIGRHFDVTLQFRPQIAACVGPKVVWDRVFSYVMCLANGGGSGGITLYDLRWKPGADGSSPMERYAGDDGISAEGLRGQLLRLGDGDALFFESGTILHEVVPVPSPQGRWTFGAFLALGRDQRSLRYFV